MQTKYDKWVTAEDPGKRPIWIVSVVNPTGTIKHIRVSPHLQAQILNPVFDEAKRLVEVGLRPGLADAGWVMLADLFREERLEAAWVAYRRWLIEGPMVGGSQVAPFPDKYMPRALIKRREGKYEFQAGPQPVVIPEMDDAVTVEPNVIDDTRSKTKRS